MKEVKVIIQKFKALYPNKKGPGDWGKFYIIDKIIFTPGVEFKTEAELAYYIYKKFGDGRYLCLAWTKGHEGFFRYWFGSIFENGFIREKDKNKEVDRLKGELAKAKSYEDREMLEEEIDFEREIQQEEKTTKLQGPVGLIKFSAGVMHSFDEPLPQKRRI